MTGKQHDCRCTVYLLSFLNAFIRTPMFPLLFAFITLQFSFLTAIQLKPKTHSSCSAPNTRHGGQRSMLASKACRGETAACTARRRSASRASTLSCGNWRAFVSVDIVQYMQAVGTMYTQMPIVQFMQRRAGNVNCT